MYQVSVGSLKNPSSQDLARLSTLSVVSNYLNASLQTDSLLSSVLSCITKAFEADRGFIRVFDSAGETHEECFLDASNNGDSDPFSFTSTHLNNCLSSRSPVLVIDTANVPPTNSVSIAGIRCVMLCPLMVEKRVIGVIYLDSLMKAGCFEENDLSLLTVLGEMVAVAVDRNVHAVTVEQQSRALSLAHEKLELAAEETIRRLSRAAEFRDGETSEHLTRVSEYCEAIGIRLGLEPPRVHAIKVASLLHDVGKLGIPDSILLKPGRFTDYERSIMQQHTNFGAKILANSGNAVIDLAAKIALSHHEKWDGTGYPSGTSGLTIPLPARIVAIADVFDAISSARRYKESYSLADSFALLERESGSHFEPALVQIFLEMRPRIELIWTENQGPEDGLVKKTTPVEVRTNASPPPKVLDPSTETSSLILVLDSDPYQREIISTEATRRGIRVHECSDGALALELADRERPDLVILETADEENEAVARALRDRFPLLPLLILTRDGALARRLSVSALGHCSYLHKPLPPEAILDEVEERLPVNDENQSRTVLAFDDDNVILTVIGRVLRRHGYRVFTVSDPVEFWELLTEHTPDIVLLDLEMPHVNGFEICRILRHDVKFRHLPIVVLTANQEISEYQKALEAGADDVLEKPIQAQRLISRLESRMARNRALQISGSRDPLTGFVHRRLAVRIAEQMFTSAVHQKLPFSVCSLHIDDFGKMVEQNGWKSSANILCQVAELVGRSSRGEDVLTRSRDYSLLLVLQGIDRESAEQRVKSLNAKLSQHKGPLSAVRVSGRVASIPVDGNDLKSLLEAVGFSYNAGY